MGIFESITHKEEIQSLLDDAQTKFNTAKRKLEIQKKRTVHTLEKLGKLKIKIWANEIDSYLEAYQFFKSIDMDISFGTNTRFVGQDIDCKQMILNMQSASTNAIEITSIGAASLGTGALVGVASYSGAMMFGKASTGTAISTLKGAAQKNATLSWFGGGSLKSGGYGIEGGKLVLAGIVTAPILAVSALLTGIKGKEKLENAKQIHADAIKASNDLKIITLGMKKIEKVANKYCIFLRKFKKHFHPFIAELDRVKKHYQTQGIFEIDFNQLTALEKKSINISWRMTQIYYQLLTNNIISDTGSIDPTAIAILESSKIRYKKIKQETYKMQGEESAIGDVVWSHYAHKAMILGIINCLVLLIYGIITISNSIAISIVSFVSCLISLPIFFYFKNLPQNKLYTLRVARIAFSLLLTFLVTILL